ncbi:MAG: hypothetical protein HWE08_13700 [Alphaproteobacteria bacterium]|nr:hypothetical protein [Alphaproteobacteria bacterium]
MGQFRSKSSGRSQEYTETVNTFRGDPDSAASKGVTYMEVKLPRGLTGHYVSQSNSIQNALVTASKEMPGTVVALSGEVIKKKQ